MSDAFDLNELLADADAYFTAGHAEAAIDALFEGIDECRSQPDAQTRIAGMLSLICHAFWQSREFEEGKRITGKVVNEALRRVGGRVDPEYLDIYIAACAATGTSPFPVQRIFRHQNLIRVFLDVAKDVGGDVAECGCLRGLSFLELCLTFSRMHPHWKGEAFHIFDSFEGLSEPTSEDLQFTAHDENKALIAGEMVRGRYACSMEVVSENVRRLFPHVELHPGWIGASFAGQPERTYRFVHVDVDLYQPTADSLKYFFPRLACGGVIITDDYDWPGAQKAFQEFAAQEGLELLTTGTNQAFFRKG
jgi:hypothetical protein